MNYNVTQSMQILQRTPNVLRALLAGLPEDWTASNEGEGSWSPFDIVGHLIHGEKTDWVPRMELILSKEPNKVFEPFDRFAQFRESKDKTLQQLLREFEVLREQNLQKVRAANLSETDLARKGEHPSLGVVTLSQLLATWTVHDLNHLAQISRVMAGQYRSEVGPWVAYLKILNW
jgi:hypothetical protein